MFYIILLIYLKLEDLWRARHKKVGGGEGDKSAKGKRERILFASLHNPLYLFLHSSTLSRPVTQARRPSNVVSERR